MTPQIKFVQTAMGYNLPIPSRATPGSAGFDLRAAITEPLTLYTR